MHLNIWQSLGNISNKLQSNYLQNSTNTVLQPICLSQIINCNNINENVVDNRRVDREGGAYLGGEGGGGTFFFNPGEAAALTIQDTSYVVW